MKNFKNIGKTVFALAVMISLGGAIATPAHADDWHDHDHGREHDREWRHHEREAHDYHYRHFHHEHERPVFVREPNVVYAPPVIIAPPAVASIEDSSPGLNITVPINFR